MSNWSSPAPPVLSSSPPPPSTVGNLFVIDEIVQQCSAACEEDPAVGAAAACIQDFDGSIERVLLFLHSRVASIEQRLASLDGLGARVDAVETQMPHFMPTQALQDEIVDTSPAASPEPSSVQHCKPDFELRVLELEDHVKPMLEALQRHKPFDERSQQRIEMVETDIKRLNERHEKEKTREPDSPSETGCPSDEQPEYMQWKIQDVYELEESAWDLAIFIGTKHVGFAVSIFSIVLLALALFMQFVFCFIINDQFTVPWIDRDVVDDLLKWRHFAGHDYKWVDPISHHSLAHRVCDLDASLPMSSGIMNVLETINGYLPRESDYEFNSPAIGHSLPQFEGVGQLLCVIGLMIWYLTLAKDLSEVLALAMAIRVVRTDEQTTIVCEADGGLRIAAMTSSRKLFVIILSLSRLVAIIAMFLAGTLYLAYTISLTDIILNAVALDIVFQLDELIYAALAPSQARAMLKSFAPLPTRFRPLLFAGLNAKPVCFFIGVMTLSMACVPVFLQPQVDILRDAREAICGGNTHFVAAVNKFGVVIAHPDEGIDTSGGRAQSTYTYKALQQLIEDPLALSTGISKRYPKSLSEIATSFSGADYSLTGAADLTVEQVTVLWNWQCEDSQGWPYSLILADAINRPSVHVTCTDALPYCNQDSFAGVRSRQYCPETCGCRQPLSSLVLFSAFQGCPDTCAEHPDFKTEIATTACEDQKTASEPFRNYRKGLSEFIEAYPAGWTSLAKDILKRLEIEGCGAALPFLPEGGKALIALCSEKNSYLLKPIKLLCPISCKCKETLIADARLSLCPKC